MKRFLLAVAALGAVACQGMRADNLVIAPSADPSDNWAAPEGTNLAPGLLFNDADEALKIKTYGQVGGNFNFPAGWFHDNVLNDPANIAADGQLFLLGGPPMQNNNWVDDANGWRGMNSAINLVNLGGTCGKVWLLNAPGSDLVQKTTEMGLNLYGDLAPFDSKINWYDNSAILHFYPSPEKVAAIATANKVARVRMEVNIYQKALLDVKDNNAHFKVYGRDDQGDTPDANTASQAANQAANMVYANDFVDAIGSWDPTKWRQVEFDMIVKTAPEDVSTWTYSSMIKMEIIKLMKSNSALLIRNIYVVDQGLTNDVPDDQVRINCQGKYNYYSVEALKAHELVASVSADKESVVPGESVHLTAGLLNNGQAAVAAASHSFGVSCLTPAQETMEVGSLQVSDPLYSWRSLSVEADKAFTVFDAPGAYTFSAAATHPADGAEGYAEGCCDTPGEAATAQVTLNFSENDAPVIEGFRADHYESGEPATITYICWTRDLHRPANGMSAQPSADAPQGYDVYRRVGDDGQWEQLGETLPGNALEYKTTEEQPSDAQYAVTAHYGDGVTVPSNVIKAADVSVTGLDDALAPQEGRAVVGRFTPDGRQAAAGASGVVITRYSDGTATKTFVR